MNDYENFSALYKQVLDSKGMEYLGRRKIRAFALNIFEENFNEIQKTCAVIEDAKAGVKLIHTAQQGEGYRFHMEVARLFHNFLASAKTLVDHTRCFMEDHYEGTLLKQNYDRRVADHLSQDQLIKFVHDLRNYMLHKGLPTVHMSLDATRIPETNSFKVLTTVIINKEKLLLWEKWTQLSRAFLEEAEEHLKISNITSAYSNKILSFYQWFDTQLVEHHKDDIAELEKLQIACTAAEASLKSAVAVMAGKNNGAE